MTIFIALNACIYSIPQFPWPVNSQATAAQITAGGGTGSAMAQSTLTWLPPNETVSTTHEPTATPTWTSATMPSETPTASPVNTLTPTISLPTETATPFPMDKLPAGLPTAKLKLENTTKKPIYLSLHGTIVPQGYHTVIEYRFRYSMVVEVPQGNYVYVAWVGGSKIVGNISLLKAHKMTLTFHNDKVTVH